MTQTEVISKLQTVFDGIFQSEVKLTPDLSAKDVPEWDSLVHISVVVGTEEAFAIRFGAGEVERTRNIGELADLIIKRLAKH